MYLRLHTSLTLSPVSLVLIVNINHLDQDILANNNCSIAVIVYSGQTAKAWYYINLLFTVIVFVGGLSGIFGSIFVKCQSCCHRYRFDLQHLFVYRPKENQPNSLALSFGSVVPYPLSSMSFLSSWWLFTVKTWSTHASDPALLDLEIHRLVLDLPQSPPTAIIRLSNIQILWTHMQPPVRIANILSRWSLFCGVLLSSLCN